MFVIFNRLRYQSHNLSPFELLISRYIIYIAHGSFMSRTFRYAIVHPIVCRLFYLPACRIFNCDDS